MVSYKYFVSIHLDFRQRIIVEQTSEHYSRNLAFILLMVGRKAKKVSH